MFSYNASDKKGDKYFATKPTGGNGLPLYMLWDTTPTSNPRGAELRVIDPSDVGYWSPSYNGRTVANGIPVN